MIIEEFLNDGALVRHVSDSGVTLLQVETGFEYGEAIDVVPCRYTYTETENPVEPEEEIEAEENDMAETEPEIEE